MLNIKYISLSNLNKFKEKLIANTIFFSSADSSLSSNNVQDAIDELDNLKCDNTDSRLTDSRVASDVYDWAKSATKPSYTKSEIGLGNVDNKSSETIREEITKENVVNALGYTPPTSDTNTTYSVATSTTLGLVKSGTDITVDSSGNVSVNDDSHNHTIENIDGLQEEIDDKLGVDDNAVSATKLYTARAITANLASTTGTSFDGSEAVSIGTTGTLPTSKGGTGNTTGLAASATKLATARTITAGLATSSGTSFDGSSAVTIAVSGTLPIASGGTGATTATAAKTALGITDTDTKVTQSATTVSTYRPVLFGSTTSSTVSSLTTTTTAQTYVSSGIYVQPSTNKLIATGGFTGALTGNATTATTLETARTIQTNLSSTSGTSFNGSANITVGVTGTLAVTNGGTGGSTASEARTNIGCPPTSHASTANTYGLGSDSNYGHLKISDLYLSSGGNASSGVSASSYALNQCYSDLNEKIDGIVAQLTWQ